MDEGRHESHQLRMSKHMQGEKELPGFIYTVMGEVINQHVPDFSTAT